MEELESGCQDNCRLLIATLEIQKVWKATLQILSQKNCQVRSLQPAKPGFKTATNHNLPGEAKVMETHDQIPKGLMSTEGEEQINY